ncbi:hypothetical protein QQ045_031575 [Rhodiola kirilowii]
MMHTILCWNARGPNNKGTIDYLKLLKDTHKLGLCAILEPKSGTNAIEKLAFSLKFPYFSHCNPTNSHIWLLWDKPFQVDILAHSMLHITAKVCYEEVTFTCSFIYASTDQTTRVFLWEKLCSLAPQIDGPWFLAGDFNVVATWAEKQGGNPPNQGAMMEFNDFMMQAGISDAGYSGCPYTWSNNQQGNICDVNKLVKEKKTLVDRLELQLQEGWDDQTQIEVTNAKADLANYLRFQYSILEEKARINWIHDGDRNTALFHASIKARRIRNNVRLKLGEDSYTEDGGVIGLAATEHFKKLFGEVPNHKDIEVEDQISPSISEADNRNLCQPPDDEEIYDTIMKMNHDSAPGPDGYTGKFFSGCWSIIKEDLTKAIQSFFEGL